MYVTNKAHLKHFMLQKHLLLQAHTIQKFEVCKIFSNFFTKATFICSKIPLQTVIFYYILKFHLFPWCKADFSVPLVFSVTWPFRNHYNMQISCSKNISYYKQCWTVVLHTFFQGFYILLINIKLKRTAFIWNRNLQWLYTCIYCYFWPVKVLFSFNNKKNLTDPKH